MKKLFNAIKNLFSSKKDDNFYTATAIFSIVGYPSLTETFDTCTMFDKDVDAAIAKAFDIYCEKISHIVPLYEEDMHFLCNIKKSVF